MNRRCDLPPPVVPTQKLQTVNMDRAGSSGACPRGQDLYLYGLSLLSRNASTVRARKNQRGGFPGDVRKTSASSNAFASMYHGLTQRDLSR